MDMRFFALLLVAAVAIEASSDAFDCGKKDHGDYPDPSSACSAYFYTCSPVGATVNSCPDGTAYDTDLKVCNWLDALPQCKDQKPTTSTAAPIQATSAASLPSSETQGNPSGFSCAGKSDGNFPMGSCESRFWQCANGVAYPTNCGAPHLRFNADSNQCLEQNNVPSCGSQGRQSRQANPSVPATFDCSNKKDGNYPWGACVSKFWQCSNQVSFPMVCGAPFLRYSPEKDQCLPSSDVLGCQTSRRRRQLNTGFSCAGKTDGDWAVGICRDSFATCSNGQTTELQCTGGTVFDSLNKRCEWKDLVAECKGALSSIASSSVMADVPTTPLVTSFSCNGKPDGDYANPDAKCSKFFWKCASGQMTQALCPADLLFDTSLHLCNYPQNVQC